jgi:hypothetical protein
VVGPSEIGSGSERSAIERRTKIGGKKLGREKNKNRRKKAWMIIQ